MNSFTSRIAPHVRAELHRAEIARAESRIDDEFSHLETAHVLGQESTYWHVYTHIAMAGWAWRQHNLREGLGQLFRIVGAATKTMFGLVPRGNTGGAHISPFKSLPVRAEVAALIKEAKQGT